MPPNIIQQWTEFSNSSLETLTQMSQASMNGFNQMISQPEDGNLIASFVELLKSSISSIHKINVSHQEMMNKLLQRQLTMMNLSASADALKGLNDIATSTMSDFFQQQTSLISLYTDALSSYLQQLQQANTMEEVIESQRVTFLGLQNQLKENTMQTLTMMNRIKTSMTAWTNRVLEEQAANQSSK